MTTFPEKSAAFIQTGSWDHASNFVVGVSKEIVLIFGQETVSQVTIITFVQYSATFPEKSAQGCSSSGSKTFFIEFFQSLREASNQDKKSPKDGQTSIEISNFIDEGNVDNQHSKAVTQGIFHFPCFSFKSNNNSV